MLKRTEIAIFILLAFEILRDPKYKCLHVVWSGFNEAFRTFFSEEDPVTWMKAFHKEDLIDLYLMKGGATVKPRINLLHSLTADERVVASRQREFLEQFARTWKMRLKVRQTPVPSTEVPPEERAEQMWNAGQTFDALKLLGYVS